MSVLNKLHMIKVHRGSCFKPVPGELVAETNAALEKQWGMVICDVSAGAHMLVPEDTSMQSGGHQPAMVIAGSCSAWE